MMIGRDIAKRARRLLSAPRTGWSTELMLGILLLAGLFGLVLFAPWITSHEPDVGELRNRLQPIGAPGHLLGTDHIGQDVWARLIAGLTWSITAAIASTVLSLIIGLILGLIAAAYKGWPRTLIRWGIDTIIALPGLVIAICIIAIIGQGWLPIVLTLGLLGWPVFARVVFAEASSLMQRNYVVNARLQGVAQWKILLRHVAPGVRPTLTVMTAFQVADMLIAESALSFLGIGAPLGAPTWGNMLAESRQFIFSAPELVLAPGLAIIVTVIAVNLFGDGLALYFRQQRPVSML